MPDRKSLSSSHFVVLGNVLNEIKDKNLDIHKMKTSQGIPGKKKILDDSFKQLVGEANKAQITK